MTGAEKAESVREHVDPSAADPEAAAREEAERYGLPFEVALENVRVSIAKRAAAAAHIRAVQQQVRSMLAEGDHSASSGQDGRDASEDIGEAGEDPSPDRPT